jgi:oxygen-independent coproporphyrinogen-3 oxidase
MSASHTPVRSLYVHVPFCAAKCEYCAFFSEPSGGGQMNRYVEALIREMELVASSIKPRTIFFGGGTPSLLSLAQWRRVLEAMERLDLLGADEWTVECNPATVSAEKARLLREHGVNRISMGVQSLDEGLLDRLGRIHSRGMVFKSFDRLRAAGFDNINLDLMFAIPGQTMAIWKATMAEAIAMGSEHLSCYEVIYEEDTPLYEQMQAGEFDVDDELACAMYDELIDTAAAAGFAQYEVANFARPDGTPGGELPSYACQHNVNYWCGGACQALGPSATGYVDGRRIRNIANTERYCRQLELGQRAHESVEQLSPLGRAGETAAFGLRMNAGWPFRLFEQTTGFDLRNEWAGDMQRAVDSGWGARSDDRFRLTRQGMRFADTVAEWFIRPEP